MSRLNVILILLGLAGLILALWLVSNAIIVAAGPALAFAETTFTATTVLNVDQAGRQLTVRTDHRRRVDVAGGPGGSAGRSEERGSGQF